MTVRYYLNGSEWHRSALDSDLEHLSWHLFSPPEKQSDPLLLKSYSSLPNNLSTAIDDAMALATEQRNDVWVSAEPHTPAGGWPL